MFIFVVLFIVLYGIFGVFFLYFLVLCFTDSEKEGELCRLIASQKDQADQAQKALDDFKVQVENSSAQMYEHMKIQV